MDNALCLDTETLIYAKGNCYSTCSGLVSIHTYDGTKATSSRPREFNQETIDRCSTIVGFNFKFDVGHLRKAGFRISRPVWDVQLAHYVLSGQSKPFPSLNEVLEHYGLEPKLDIVATEYWAKGIDTDKVPWEVLCEYGEYDCIGTWDCFLRQYEEFKQNPRLFQMFKLRCQDLLVLQEMEWNGLKYNSTMCKEKSEQLKTKIKEITSKLSNIYPDLSINFNSGDQLSAFLYGGTITEETREIIGFYKTGNRIGEPRYKVGEITHQLPRLVAPLPRSELKKAGCYATDENTLKKLRGSKRAKELIELLLELAKLEKLNGTYFEGMNKINQEMMWPKDELHPVYNQCVARTGRLSSSKPNAQNMGGEALEVFESRYE